MDSLTIRRYRSDDRAAVLALHHLALHDVGAHLGDGAWDEDLDAIESVYLADSGEFLVGELAGTIVAMGALRRCGPERAEVKRMRVDPAHQGCGFGRRMLQTLEQRARELGYATLTLDTTTGQTVARGLYARHGFLETGRERVGPFTVILMAKALGSADELG